MRGGRRSFRKGRSATGVCLAGDRIGAAPRLRADVCPDRRSVRAPPLSTSPRSYPRRSSPPAPAAHGRWHTAPPDGTMHPAAPPTNLRSAATCCRRHGPACNRAARDFSGRSGMHGPLRSDRSPPASEFPGPAEPIAAPFFSAGRIPPTPCGRQRGGRCSHPTAQRS